MTSMSSSEVKNTRFGHPVVCCNPREDDTYKLMAIIIDLVCNLNGSIGKVV